MKTGGFGEQASQAMPVERRARSMTRREQLFARSFLMSGTPRCAW